MAISFVGVGPCYTAQLAWSRSSLETEGKALADVCVLVRNLVFGNVRHAWYGSLVPMDYLHTIGTHYGPPLCRPIRRIGWTTIPYKSYHGCQPRQHGFAAPNDGSHERIIHPHSQSKTTSHMHTLFVAFGIQSSPFNVEEQKVGNGEDPEPAPHCRVRTPPSQSKTSRKE